MVDLVRASRELSMASRLVPKKRGAQDADDRDRDQQFYERNATWSRESRVAGCERTGCAPAMRCIAVR